MANKIKCKGTQLQVYTGAVYTTVPSVISLTLPPQVQETFESDTLDNSTPGITKQTTGRVDGGEFSAEIFYDPADSTHQAISDLIASTPADVLWKVIFADTGSSYCTFTTAGVSFGNVAVALNNGLTATVAGPVDGAITWPT